MSRRYAIGPLPSDFADGRLSGPCSRGECLTFSPADLRNFPSGQTDTWSKLCRKGGGTCELDFLVLHLPYATIPEDLWRAPVPIIVLAFDWNLLWHGLRWRFRQCDLILTDTMGVETLAREGVTHARVANLFGLGREWLKYPWPEGPRDIDILFVGNLHPAVQRERLVWLGRLARLADRWRVVIATGVFGDQYRVLLARSRVAFNRSVRGECNQRALEAVAAGALLFQERENREVPDYLCDRQECVLYGDDDLEELLNYYTKTRPAATSDGLPTTSARCTRCALSRLIRCSSTSADWRPWTSLSSMGPTTASM